MISTNLKMHSNNVNNFHNNNIHRMDSSNNNNILIHQPLVNSRYFIFILNFFQKNSFKFYPQSQHQQAQTSTQQQQPLTELGAQQAAADPTSATPPMHQG